MSTIKSALSSPNPAPITEVPGLYLSDITIPTSSTHLKDHGITHVLSIMFDKSHPTIPQDLGITHKIFVLDDDPLSNLLAILPEACAFIDSAFSPQPQPPTTSPSTTPDQEVSTSPTAVLVHCTQGISRSPAVAIAYLMHRLDITYPAALAIVQKHRPIAFPNHGFAEQLELWGRMRFDMFERDAEGRAVREKAVYLGWKARRQGKMALAGGEEAKRGRVSGMAALAARVGRRRIGEE